MTDENNEYRAGFVAILGKPNAGKSTLLNTIVGEKLAAVSALPQTTRDRFFGIYSDDNRQIVFVDLPGLIRPSDKLNEALLRNVMDGIEGVDAILHLIDVADRDPFPEDIVKVVSASPRPVILGVNKIDGKQARTDARSWSGERVPPTLAGKYAATVGLSAKDNAGVDALLDALTVFIPEGPPLYDPEQLTDRDLRYLAQEMIREKAFLFLHEELPYSTVVEIDEFKERDRGKWYIQATIFVERDSQKGMVIGKSGAMLKKISAAARTDIERVCDAPVFLELWVKVREKWRANPSDLRRFGYGPRKR